jgi:hypothetical protein
MKTLIAIDPGASGGLAVMWPPHGNRVLKPMPESESELCAYLKYVCDNCNNDGYKIEACLEKVGGFVGKKQPGSTMFTFGRGVGVIVGTLMALGIPFREVRPQEWQKAVGAGTTGKRTKTQWKNHLKDMAQKRNPGHKITLKTADAALMLDWLHETAM